MGIQTWYYRHVLLRTKYRHAHAENARSRSSRGVLIVGWYGMETTGDKAILGSILQSLDWPETVVYQASYDVEYSRQTLREIGFEQVTVVPNDLDSIANVLAKVDVAVIGGGPLMQAREMRRWYRQLLLAKAMGKQVMIYGCGVGPIRTGKEAKAIRRVLSLADEIHVRDELAAENARRIGGSEEKIRVTADPVLNFEYPRLAAKREHDVLQIGISVRSLPRSYYSAEHSSKPLEVVRKEYEECFVSLIQHLCKRPEVRITLVPMQMHAGDDDRVLLRRIREQVNANSQVQVVEGYGSPQELLALFDHFDFFVGMRFHSVVFSYVSGTPAVGIDYDMQRGKVSGVMHLMQNSDYTINIRDITAERLIALVDCGLNNREKMRTQIRDRLAVVQHQERQNALTLKKLLQAA